MKRLTSVILALILSLTLVGCAGPVSASSAPTSPESVPSSSASASSSPESSAVGDEFAEWCSHPQELRNWIHGYASEVFYYLGLPENAAYTAKLEKSMETMTAEQKDAWTVMTAFSDFGFSRDEVITALRLGANTDEQIRYVLKQMFGDEDLSYTPVAMEPGLIGNSLDGCYFNDETLSADSAGVTAHNSIPSGVIAFVGVRQLNKWAAQQTQAEYTVENLLKDLQVPIEVYTFAVLQAREAAAALPTGSGSAAAYQSIYTQELYQSVIKQVYGSETALALDDTDTQQYYDAYAAAFAQRVKDLG